MSFLYHFKSFSIPSGRPFWLLVGWGECVRTPHPPPLLPTGPAHGRCKVIENRERLMNAYIRFLPPNTVKFLRSLDNTPSSTKPAKLYAIPKIHKTPMASSRPRQIVLGTFGATFSNFSNLEQLLAFWATFEQLCIDMSNKNNKN